MSPNTPGVWEPSEAYLDPVDAARMAPWLPYTANASDSVIEAERVRLESENARLRAVITKIKDALEAIQSEFLLDGDLSDIVDAGVEAALTGEAA